tara:strand:- start:16468 stop:16869 length:402 start_codon:yes stop_codon:yes gene_type:complete
MEKLEAQIREQYQKAFWDLVDQDPPDTDHIRKLVDELEGVLCAFVPSRIDIHRLIHEDLGGEIDWSLQTKLIKWAEMFQAPLYDQITQKWKKNLPEKLSEFLKKYYEHLETINKQVWNERKKIADGPILRSGR